MRLDAAVFVYCTGQCADWRSPRGQDWSSRDPSCLCGKGPSSLMIGG